MRLCAPRRPSWPPLGSMGQSALGGEATFAETQSNGQDAPISAIDLEAMRYDRSEFVAAISESQLGRDLANVG